MSLLSRPSPLSNLTVLSLEELVSHGALRSQMPDRRRRQLYHYTTEETLSTSMLCDDARDDYQSNGCCESKGQECEDLATTLNDRPATIHPPKLREAFCMNCTDGNEESTLEVEVATCDPESPYMKSRDSKAHYDCFGDPVCNTDLFCYVPDGQCVVNLEPFSYFEGWDNTSVTTACDPWLLSMARGNDTLSDVKDFYVQVSYSFDNCAPGRSWLGDGFCDPSYNCKKFGYDCGDCDVDSAEIDYFALYPDLCGPRLNRYPHPSPPPTQ